MRSTRRIPGLLSALIAGLLATALSHRQSPPSPRKQPRGR